MPTRKKYATETDKLCDLLFNPPPLEEPARPVGKSEAKWVETTSLAFALGLLTGLMYRTIGDVIAWLIW